jgi:hypothetical protein
VYYDQNSGEPPLLAVNHQIRHEAAKLYYLANTFRIVIQDFHPRVLLRLQRHLAAANIEHRRFWSAAQRRFAYGQLQPQDSWQNVKFWFRLIHQRRVPCDYPSPRAMPHAMRHARGWFIFGGMFYLVSQLSETPWSVVEKILEDQRYLLAVAIKRSNVYDRSLLPLAQTPTVGNN